MNRGRPAPIPCLLRRESHVVEIMLVEKLPASVRTSRPRHCRDRINDEFEFAFAALESFFTQCPLDGDAGNVCDLRDQILLNLCRARRTALENGESSHHASVSCVNRRRPLRAEAMREQERSNRTRLKAWIRFKICHDHLCLSKRCYPAGSDRRRNSQ